MGHLGDYFGVGSASAVRWAHAVNSAAELQVHLRPASCEVAPLNLDPEPFEGRFTPYTLRFTSYTLNPAPLDFKP